MAGTDRVNIAGDVPYEIGRRVCLVSGFLFGKLPAEKNEKKIRCICSSALDDSLDDSLVDHEQFEIKTITLLQ